MVPETRHFLLKISNIMWSSDNFLLKNRIMNERFWLCLGLVWLNFCQFHENPTCVVEVLRWLIALWTRSMIMYFGLPRFVLRFVANTTLFQHKYLQIKICMNKNIWRLKLMKYPGASHFSSKSDIDGATRFLNCVIDHCKVSASM